MCLNLIKKLGIGPERLGLMLRIKVYGYVSSGMDAGISPTILFELKIVRMLTREDMVFRIILHCKLIHPCREVADIVEGTLDFEE